MRRIKQTYCGGQKNVVGRDKSKVEVLAVVHFFYVGSKLETIILEFFFNNNICKLNF